MPQARSSYSNFCIVINEPIKNEPTGIVDPSFKELNELNSLDTDITTDTIIAKIKEISEIKDYFIILHDKDIKEDGTPKTKHWHLIITTISRISQANILGILFDNLEVPLNCISVEGARNLTNCIQYLVHKNQEQKFKYETDLIETNNKQLLLSELAKKQLTKEEIIKALEDCYTMEDFIKNTNLDTAKNYRALYNDIKEEQHKDIKGIIETNKILLQQLNDTKATNYKLASFIIKLAKNNIENIKDQDIKKLINYVLSSK